MKITAKIIPITVAIFLPILINSAKGVDYEKKILDSHIIHIVRLDPDEYKANIVKANNGRFGRETVSSMAEKSNAQVAINAGFFEMYGLQDGRPSGSLVIDDKIYGLKKEKQPLIVIQNGFITIWRRPPEELMKQGTSLVSGIPLLAKDGKIPQRLLNQKGQFYTKPHARTALGIDAQKKIIIVLAEHLYTRDMSAFTLGELQSIMKQKGKEFCKNINKEDPGEITLNELRQILKDEFAPKAGAALGLSILELANLMLELGCKEAINLDGGGSSTLWIDGHVVNNIFGDEDEAKGEKVQRPVSDAIIFKKR